MDDLILSIKNVTKTFPGVKALDNVSFDVKRGTVHAICGENGAGKSTLMKIISGAYSAIPAKFSSTASPWIPTLLPDSPRNWVSVSFIRNSIWLTPYPLRRIFS